MCTAYYAPATALSDVDTFFANLLGNRSPMRSQMRRRSLVAAWSKRHAPGKGTSNSARTMRADRLKTSDARST